jgi:hypothetical protein
MLMLVPLSEKLIPSGTPEIETLTDGEVASALDGPEDEIPVGEAALRDEITAVS